jgi:hypothetical protein
MPSTRNSIQRIKINKHALNKTYNYVVIFPHIMCSENVLIIVEQLYYSRSSNQGYDDAVCNIFVTKLIRS